MHRPDMERVGTPVLDRRAFALEDQRAFAALSGDWNPLHVDPEAARRTPFGAAVVHGVHLLLWALDRAVAAPVRVVSLRAQWKRPARVGDEVELEVSGDPDRLVLQARVQGQLVLEATVALAAGAASDTRAVPPGAWPEPVAPTFVSRDEIATAQGTVGLAIDPDRAGAMFPGAARHLGAIALAELLATTRLVGMRCPGLHSVYAGIQLAAEAREPLALDYRVSRANLKYSLVELAVEGPTLSGTLETFYRPAPQPAPSVDEIRRHVRAGEFADRRALVVGGSRGIGEAIARCLAVGGARVCVTYHRGASDAAAVAADHPDAIRVQPFDVTGAARLAWPFDEPPTHLYYLATPRIPAVGGFSMAELDEMLRYYVGGLYAAVEAAVSPEVRLAVWAPSTVFLDQGAGNPAYAIAKAAMEELGRRLPKTHHVAVRMPRLPRLATDQTAGLIQLPAAPVLDVVLAELRAQLPS
jgi:acyl dehydratase